MTIWSFIKSYGPAIAFVLLTVNYGVLRTIQLSTYAQSCMTTDQIAADSRCLLIYGTNVYQKGSKSNPHYGHACGSDVTSVMPGNHTSRAAQYLDPTLVGAVCSNTPTNTPTSAPTSTPQPTATTAPNPTATITQSPNNTATPTTKPQATATPVSTQPPGNKTPTPTTKQTTQNKTPTPTKPTINKNIITTQQKTTLSPTPQPQTASSGGFGSLMKKTGERTNPVSLASAQNPSVSSFIFVQAKTIDPMVRWSQISVVVSFVFFLLTSVFGILKRVFSQKSI
jgi:hypothetical protein